jgi:hypothetical protein
VLEFAFKHRVDLVLQKAPPTCQRLGDVGPTRACEETRAARLPCGAPRRGCN